MRNFFNNSLTHKRHASLIILLAAVSLTLFAILSIGGAGAQAACVQPLSGNGTFNGTWNNSCLSENTPLGSYTYPDGTRYARFYTFTLSAPSTVTVELSSSVDTYMYLMQNKGKTGTILYHNDDIITSVNTNSRISQSLSAGDYTIEATTYEVEAPGSFTLKVEGLPVTGTLTPTPTQVPGSTPQPTPVLTATPVRTATPTPTQTTGSSVTAKVAAGANHACAIDNNGFIRCQGKDDAGQVSRHPRGQGYVDISVGARHSCAIDRRGAIHCWGASDHRQTSPPRGSGFVALDSGDNFTCAIRPNSSLQCWGRFEGASPLPPTPTPTVAPTATPTATPTSGYDFPRISNEMFARFNRERQQLGLGTFQRYSEGDVSFISVQQFPVGCQDSLLNIMDLQASDITGIGFFPWTQGSECGVLVKTYHVVPVSQRMTVEQSIWDCFKESIDIRQPSDVSCGGRYSFIDTHVKWLPSRATYTIVTGSADESKFTALIPWIKRILGTDVSRAASAGSADIRLHLALDSLPAGCGEAYGCNTFSDNSGTIYITSDTTSRGYFDQVMKHELLHVLLPMGHLPAGNHLMSVRTTDPSQAGTLSNKELKLMKLYTNPWLRDGMRIEKFREYLVIE